MPTLTLATPAPAAPLLSEKEIADIKAEHGDELVYTEQRGVAFVFRPPGRAEWNRFQSGLLQATKRNGGAVINPGEQLCLDCLVHPKTAEGKPDLMALRELMNRKPGLSSNLSGQLQDLAGGGDDETLGKL
jgi:hypothetical protein